MVCTEWTEIDVDMRGGDDAKHRNKTRTSQNNQPLSRSNLVILGSNQIKHTVALHVFFTGIICPLGLRQPHDSSGTPQ